MIRCYVVVIVRAFQFPKDVYLEPAYWAKTGELNQIEKDEVSMQFIIIMIIMILVIIMIIIMIIIMMTTMMNIMMIVIIMITDEHNG